jgi:hypothetical protein
MMCYLASGLYDEVMIRHLNDKLKTAIMEMAIPRLEPAGDIL